MAEQGWEIPQWLYNLPGYLAQQAQAQSITDPGQRAEFETKLFGAPLNPVNSSTPVGDSAPVEYRATANDYNRLNEAIDAAYANGQITEYEYKQFSQELDDHWTEPGRFNGIQQRFDETTKYNADRAAVDAERAKYQAALDEGRANLDTYETEIGAQIEGDITRYQNVLGSGGLKSDAQYAAIMRDAQNILGAQLNTVHQNAAKSMSDAGLRASGKGGGNAAFVADQAAFGKKAEINTGLMADAQSRLTDAQNRKQTFGAGVMDMRNQLNAGYLPSMTSLTQYGQSLMQPSTFKTYATGLDVGSQIYGQRLGERALNTQENLGWAGIMSNFISQQNQNMTSMLGMVRGGG